jgi:hypothetical protein
MPAKPRRSFLKLAAAGGAAIGVPATFVGAQPATTVVPPRSATGLDGLNLDVETRADIERFADVVLRDVASVSELPLEKVDLPFVFVPRG